MSTTTPAVRILRIGDVIAKSGLCRTTIYKRERRGEWPQRVDLGGGRCGWYEHEVDEHLLSLERAELGSRTPDEVA